MAQFDVHRLANGPNLVVDCQSHLHDHIDSRFVVPLVPKDDAPTAVRRLNPVFVIDGEEYVMVTQSAAAVARNRLGPVIESLADRGHEIVGALDVLITGV
jgi:toxin CcdB